MTRDYLPETASPRATSWTTTPGVAQIMLPHLAGRPVTMHRFPDGIHGEDFYHQEAPDYFPDWIDG